MPSAAETLPEFNVDSWYAMFAPKGTSKPIIEKTQKTLAESASRKKIQDAFLAQGAIAVAGTPSELENVVKKEIAAWRTLAKEANIQVD